MKRVEKCAIYQNGWKSTGQNLKDWQITGWKLAKGKRNTKCDLMTSLNFCSFLYVLYHLTVCFCRNRKLTALPRFFLSVNNYVQQVNAEKRFKSFCHIFIFYSWHFISHFSSVTFHASAQFLCDIFQCFIFHLWQIPFQRNSRIDGFFAISFPSPEFSAPVKRSAGFETMSACNFMDQSAI